MKGVICGQRLIKSHFLVFILAEIKIISLCDLTGSYCAVFLRISNCSSSEFCLRKCYPAIKFSSLIASW